MEPPSFAGQIKYGRFLQVFVMRKHCCGLSRLVAAMPVSLAIAAADRRIIGRQITFLFLQMGAARYGVFSENRLSHLMASPALC